MKPDWTPEETARARDMKEQGVTLALIAHAFGRTKNGVRKHLQYRAENPA